MLKVSPNPTTSYFSITNSNIFRIDIQIFNAVGKLVEEFVSIQPQSKVDFGNSYGAGIYYIKAVGNTKTTFKKIIRL
jgi:hypothetical protein